MNLMSCYQDCIYQRDGCCRMGSHAPIGVVVADGCSYFRKRGGGKPAKSKKKPIHNKPQ